MGKTNNAMKIHWNGQVGHVVGYTRRGHDYWRSLSNHYRNPQPAHRRSDALSGQVCLHIRCRSRNRTGVQTRLPTLQHLQVATRQLLPPTLLQRHLRRPPSKRLRANRHRLLERQHRCRRRIRIRHPHLRAPQRHSAGLHLRRDHQHTRRRDRRLHLPRRVGRRHPLPLRGLVLRHHREQL